MNDIPIIVVMRFSYWGLSGWKSDFSQQKDLLFDPARLAVRFDLAERIALPSLAAQDDRGFRLYVLSSAEMPSLAQERLRASVARLLPDIDACVEFQPYGRARKYLRHYVARTEGEAAVTAQVALDDDDGLSTDFVAGLRSRLGELHRQGTLDEAGLPHFISHPHGLGLVHGAGEPELYRHSYKFVNCGLTYVGRIPHGSLLSISHRKAPKRYGYTLAEREPFYVRSLHEMNDSRVAVSDKWERIDDWRGDAGIAARFPYLRAL